MNAIAKGASVLLDADTVLRIRDGRGTRLSCAGGIVWITQEGSANDTVLEAGDDLTLEFDGTTLAGSHRGAVVVEIHAGRVPPALVETMTPAGSSWRLLPSESRIIAMLRRTFATVVEFLQRANARNLDFDAVRSLEWSDGIPTQAARRAALRGDPRAAISDQSMLWRHI
jgi:hypothetical protein